MTLIKILEFYILQQLLLVVLTAVWQLFQPNPTYQVEILHTAQFYDPKLISSVWIL